MKNSIISVVAGLLWVPLAVSANGDAKDLVTLWRHHFTDVYVPPPQQQMHDVERLIRRQLEAEQPPAASEWAALGLSQHRLAVGERQFVVITEASSRREGRGMIVFAPDVKQGSTFLQIPHGRTDLYTGEIALELMQAHPIAAGIFSTTKRNVKLSGSDRLADMGKVRRSLFVAFTNAVSVLPREAQIVQLHGFAAGKRNGKAAANAKMIVSNGSPHPDDGVRALTRCLRTAFDGDVLLFPTEVDELGGTLNVTVQILEAVATTRFVHIEINKPTRSLLKKSPERRADLMACMG